MLPLASVANGNGRLSSEELRSQGCGLVGEIAGEHEIACPQRVFSLGGKALGRIVLVSRVNVQRLIIHAVEIVHRLSNLNTYAALHLAFSLRRRRL